MFPVPQQQLEKQQAPRRGQSREARDDKSKILWLSANYISFLGFRRLVQSIIEKHHLVQIQIALSIQPVDHVADLTCGVLHSAESITSLSYSMPRLMIYATLDFWAVDAMEAPELRWVYIALISVMTTAVLQRMGTRYGEPQGTIQNSKSAVPASRLETLGDRCDIVHVLH